MQRIRDPIRTANAAFYLWHLVDKLEGLRTIPK
jgi:hypothetical protein